MVAQAFKILIEGRKSIRRYKERQIPLEKIKRILKVATCAPSAHNAQPWRFVVITDSRIKHSLALAMARRFEKDLEKDGSSKKQREVVVSNSIKRFSEAPVLLLPCLTMKDMDLYSDKRQENEYIMGVQSVSAAIDSLLLYTHAEGLGACWYCAPLFCKEEVRKILDIPSNVDPQALITIGYPDEDVQKPRRRPLSDVVYLNKWEEKLGSE